MDRVRAINEAIAQRNANRESQEESKSGDPRSGDPRSGDPSQQNSRRNPGNREGMSVDPVERD